MLTTKRKKPQPGTPVAGSLLFLGKDEPLCVGTNAGHAAGAPGGPTPT